MRPLKLLKNKLIYFLKYRQNKIARINFYSKFLKKNDLVFDVGANVGNRVEAFLKIGARVVAIEPQDYCIKILKKKFGKNIEIIDAGLGSSEREEEIYISKTHTLSTFSQNWMKSVKDGRFKKISWSQGRIVKITTVDNLIEKYGMPKFIKIDVEGYEEEVLRGLTTSIKMISFEYTVPELRESVINCLNILEKIDANYFCNYSICESMKFEFEDWIDIARMKKFVQSEEFVNSGFGDIYVFLR